MAPKVAFSYLFVYLTTKQFVNWKGRYTFEKLPFWISQEEVKKVSMHRNDQEMVQVKKIKTWMHFFFFLLKFASTKIHSFQCPVLWVLTYAQSWLIITTNKLQNSSIKHKPLPPPNPLGYLWSQVFPYP